MTDRNNNTLTLLNGETGDFRRQLKNKMPFSVTSDTSGNVYVCYRETQEISVLSGGMTEEKILLSIQDGLSGYPEVIVYDDKTQRLLISYYDTDNVDSFKLS